MTPPREPPEAAQERLDALRLAARAAYTLERYPVSLRELNTREPFSCLTYRQLYAWYQDEGWAEERRLNRASWRRENDDERQRRQESRRDRETHSLQRLLDEAAWLRQQPTVRPKSWEAVAQVHIKTIEMFRQWEKEDREARMREEEIAAARQSEHASPLAGISDDETHRIAHFLLRQRLDLARQQREEGADAPPREGGASAAGCQ